MGLHTLWPRNYFPALHLENWHLRNEGVRHARSCTQHRASRRYFAFAHEGGFCVEGASETAPLLRRAQKWATQNEVRRRLCYPERQRSGERDPAKTIKNC